MIDFMAKHRNIYNATFRTYSAIRRPFGAKSDDEMNTDDKWVRGDRRSAFGLTGYPACRSTTTSATIRKRSSPAFRRLASSTRASRLPWRLWGRRPQGSRKTKRRSSWTGPQAPVGTTTRSWVRDGRARQWFPVCVRPSAVGEGGVGRLEHPTPGATTTACWKLVAPIPTSPLLLPPWLRTSRGREVKLTPLARALPPAGGGGKPRLLPTTAQQAQDEGDYRPMRLNWTTAGAVVRAASRSRRSTWKAAPTSSWATYRRRPLITRQASG